jgi:predicted dehydrogenase
MNRRHFLQSSTAVMAAGFTATSRGYFANETINIGLLGFGGRCRAIIKPLASIPGTRIVGVADVWEKHRQEGKAIADKAATIHNDYRELLDRKDIDAVMIASPDHWHVQMTCDACAAGKDVYVEKPLTHDLSEGARVIAAQNDNRRIVQVGTQQRSMPHIQKAYELVKAGHIGKIHKVHLSWNRQAERGKKGPLGVDPASVDWKRFCGNAPQQAFDEYRFRNWRWFWDFGGGIFTDLMVHWIDVVHWFLDLDHPQTAVAIGDWYQKKDMWETPDTVQTLLNYPEQQVQAHFEGTFYNARTASMVEFMGTEATLYIDRGGYQVIPQRKSTVQASEMILGTGPRGADFYDKPDGEMVHVANWIECMRSRKWPTAPAEAGVSAASAAHLANMALRTGETAKWKPA